MFQWMWMLFAWGNLLYRNCHKVDNRGSQPWVHVHLGVHLPIQRGTFKVSNRREIYIYTSFISKYLYIYQWILFSKAIVCLLLNISRLIMIKYFVIRNFRGTCSSVEMLKGYMVRKRLGTPGLQQLNALHLLHAFEEYWICLDSAFMTLWWFGLAYICGQVISLHVSDSVKSISKSF